MAEAGPVRGRPGADLFADRNRINLTDVNDGAYRKFSVRVARSALSCLSSADQWRRSETPAVIQLCGYMPTVH